MTLPAAARRGQVDARRANYERGKQHHEHNGCRQHVTRADGVNVGMGSLNDEEYGVDDAKCGQQGSPRALPPYAGQGRDQLPAALSEPQGNHNHQGKQCELNGLGDPIGILTHGSRHCNRGHSSSGWISSAGSGATPSHAGC